MPLRDFRIVVVSIIIISGLCNSVKAREQSNNRTPTLIGKQSNTQTIEQLGSIGSDKLQWQFRKAEDKVWYPATVPGTVHTDLLANKLIPDPFFRDNEQKVQWVENEEWEYQTFFRCDSILLVNKHLEIHFEGLDTYADVYLDDALILHADNMFREWVVDVKQFLKPDSNHLLIHFYSAIKKGKEFASQLPYKLPGDEGGKALERKAQYQFGWDFGPRFVTCGLWRPVTLQSGLTSRSELDSNTTHKESGSQFINRKVELVQTRDSVGNSFFFKLNGQPIFIKGANIIPPDNFVSRVTSDDYKKMVDDALECHMNMLRIWGGGVYLPDEFYDYCDEKGILIWQDFMFAGAMVPGDSSFVGNVKQEAIDQVIRLRNHPCIALWCGNNEINEAWHNWGYQQENSTEVNEKIWNDYQRIFDTILPAVIKEYDPQRFYWESTPSIGWGHKESLLQGDSHYWGVWWGEEDFDAYNTHVGRFMSEYGFQSFPLGSWDEFSTKDDRRTIPIDIKTANPILNAHEKNAKGFATIYKFMKENYNVPSDFDRYAYVSQLIQRDGISMAIQAHRRSKPYCMGTMYWQLNDCWPVVSWSSRDYYGNWKALQYEVKNLYQTYLISVHEENKIYNVYIISDSAKELQGKLELVLYDFTGKVLWSVNKDILVPANSSGVFLSFSKEDFPNEFDMKKAFLQATFKNNSETFATKNFFFDKPKDLVLPHSTISHQVKYVSDHSGNKDFPYQYEIELTTDKFAKDVYIDFEFEESKFSDNFFDLLPGERKIVTMLTHEPIDYVNMPFKVYSLNE